MLEGNDIIFFANDWDGDPLSKKHIALRLAQKNRVLWVNSTGNHNTTASVRSLRLLNDGKHGPDPAVSELMELESRGQKVEDLSGIIKGLNDDVQRRPLPARQAA